MDFEEEFEFSHLFMKERKCRSCGVTKDLMNDFYRAHKDRGDIPSAYSYECKECTKMRVVVSRMTNRVFDRWEYPDW